MQFGYPSSMAQVSHARHLSSIQIFTSSLSPFPCATFLARARASSPCQTPRCSSRFHPLPQLSQVLRNKCMALLMCSQCLSKCTLVVLWHLGRRYGDLGGRSKSPSSSSVAYSTNLSRWQTFPPGSHGSSQFQTHMVTRLSRCCSEGRNLLDLIIASAFPRRQSDGFALKTS
jgi:hypothetical protein